MNSISEFKKLVDEDITNYLKELETTQKSKRAKLKFARILGSVIFLVSTASLIVSIINPELRENFTHEWQVILVTLILSSFVPAIVLNDLYSKEFLKKIKPAWKTQLSALLQNVGMYWGQNQKIFTRAEIVESKLFGIFSHIQVHDSFSGSYKGVEYKFAEVTIMGAANEKIYSPTSKIFGGLIVAFPINKNVKVNTIVAGKGDKNIKNQHAEIFAEVFLFIVLSIFYYFSGYPIYLLLINLYLLYTIIIGVITNLKYSKKQDDVVHLEDTEFSNEFDVYSDDQVESRYLVTPAFMERLLRLSISFDTYKIKCSFVKDRIVFAISTWQDLFEIGDFSTQLDGRKNIERIQNEIISILDMIEYFKLNEKTRL